MSNVCSFYIKHSHNVSDSTRLFQLNTGFKSQICHDRHVPKLQFNRTGSVGFYQRSCAFALNLKQFQYPIQLHLFPLNCDSYVTHYAKQIFCAVYLD